MVGPSALSAQAAETIDSYAVNANLEQNGTLNVKAVLNLG